MANRTVNRKPGGLVRWVLGTREIVAVARNALGAESCIDSGSRTRMASFASYMGVRTNEWKTAIVLDIRHLRSGNPAFHRMALIAIGA